MLTTLLIAFFAGVLAGIFGGMLGGLIVGRKGLRPSLPRPSARSWECPAAWPPRRSFLSQRCSYSIGMGGVVGDGVTPHLLWNIKLA